MTKFVGIDPSTKTGLVVMDENGEVIIAIEITSKVKPDPQRFMDIAKQVMKELKPQDIICLEGFSYNSRGAGVSIQYGIGWLIRAELIRNGYTYTECAPTSVKKFATGKGVAKKEDLVLPLYKKWGFEHTSDNVRDAYILSRIAKGIYNPTNLKGYELEVINKLRG